MRDAFATAAVLVLLVGSHTGCGQAGDAGQAAEAPAATMEVAGQADVAAVSLLSAAVRLEGGLAGEHRSEENRARDVYRHPVETLGFLGIEPDMVVAEISPGGGWYTEILAPLLRDEGTLYAAGADPESESEYAQRSAKRFMDKLAAHPEVYDRTIVTVLAPGKREIAPRGSADAVLTFRNVHNWMGGGSAKAVFQEMFAALKPGGIPRRRRASGRFRNRPGSEGGKRLRAAGFRDRHRGIRRLRVPRVERDQREPERHEGSSQGRLDLAPQLSPRGRRP